MDRVIVVHYHEVALKGDNRSWFERRLLGNVQQALKGLPHQGVRRISGRLLVVLSEASPVGEILDRLRRVFGVAYLAEAAVADQDMERIKACAWGLLQGGAFETFKVDTRRSHKGFPLTSPQVNAEVGAFLQRQSGARVRLDDPEVTCFIEIADRWAFVYTDRVEGPGGLPVGVSEKAVSLISSGIDSPVSSYKMLKRGVRIVFVHFHSYPYTNRASQTNAERLVELLTAYQFRSKLYLVPFIDIQKQIQAFAPARYRVLLYRRAMVRIAEAIARRERAQALVTGENVAQVASQTLSNLRVISAAATLPILRPLAGEDKAEIIALAKRIGTYDISTEPYEDCCSLFIPEHPETQGRPEVVEGIEAELGLGPLLDQAVERAEVKTFVYPRTLNTLRTH